MMARYANHHMKATGFVIPKLDRAVQGYGGYPAIRGGEQQKIGFHGGVGSSNVGIILLIQCIILLQMLHLVHQHYILEYIKINEYIMNEIDILKHRCLVIANYFIELDNSPHIVAMKSIIEKQKSKKSLERINKDLNEWVRSLDEGHQNKIDELLSEVKAENLSNVSFQIIKEIETVLKNDRIKNNNEFRLINQYVDALSHNSGDKSQIEKLNSLLAKYESKL